MSAAYEAGKERVQVKLDDLVARMEEAWASGQPPSAAWLVSETRYHELLDQIDAELAKLAKDGAPIVQDAQQAQVDLAATHAETLTRAALGDAPEAVRAQVAWNALPTKALEALVGFASDGSPLHDLLLELKLDGRQGVEEILQGGLAAGENPRKIAERLQANLDISKSRALVIARTEPLRAMREASRQSYLANADVVPEWVWETARDSRVCGGCWAMQGTTLTLDQPLDDHPNGRCVMAPRPLSYAEILGDDTIPDHRPAIETGEALFGNPTVAEQQEVLGPGMWQAWNSGQVPFDRLVTQTHDARWGSMRRASTLEEALA